jgi:WD40 repeat protein
MKKLKTLIQILLLVIIPGITLAIESFPPIVPEGETIPDIQDVINQISHASPINSIDFSPDGRTIASGTWDNIIQLWDVSTGREIKRFEGHTGDIRSVNFSPDGRTIASGSDDNTIRLWDVSTGRELKRFEGHTSRIISVTFSPDGRTIASGSLDKLIRLWDVSTGRELKRFEGHTNSIRSVNFSPDGRIIVSGSGDKTIRLWDMSTGREIKRFEGHTGSIRSVNFSPDGRTIASGSDDKTIRLWNVSTGNEIKRFEGHTDFIISVKFSPDGRTIASGSTDNTFRLWDMSTGREIKRFEGHADSIRSVNFSPEGRTIASGSFDKTIRLWDVSTGRDIKRFEGHTNWIQSVNFSPDCRTIASGSTDNIIRLWDVSTGREIKRFEGHTGSIRSVNFSPDGRTIASGSFDKTIRLWDVSTGREIKRFEGHTNWIQSVNFSPDGRTIASGSSDDTIRLWDVATGRKIKRYEGHRNWIRSVNYSPDCRTLASGSYDKTIRLWDVSTGREIKRFEGHTNTIWSVNFSPDGRTIASGSTDKTIRLWDVSTGREIKRFEGHTDVISSVNFSPDGRTIASGSSDKTIRLWDVSTGREIKRFEGHTNWIRSVNFSPDGRTIASGSDDGKIIIHEKMIMIPGQRGTWLSYNIQTKKCLRYDDGTFLVNNNEGHLSPVLPDAAKQLTGVVGGPLSSLPEHLHVLESMSTHFMIHLQNPHSHQLFWIHIFQVIDTDIDCPLIFHPPPTQVVLAPGASISLSCSVSALMPYSKTTAGAYQLRLSMVSANCSPKALTIPVTIQAPDIHIQNAVVTLEDKPALRVSVINTGAMDISNKVEFQAIMGETVLDSINRSQLQAGQAVDLAFALPESLKITDMTQLSFSAKKFSHPIHQWFFDSVPYQGPMPSWQLYALLAGIVFTLFMLLFVTHKYFHPLVLQLSKKPENLIQLSAVELIKAQKLLTRTKGLDTILSFNHISPSAFASCTQFFQTTNPEQHAKIIADRLAARFETIDHTDIPMFKLHMPTDFLLNMDNCLLAFVPIDMDANDFFAHLKKVRDTHFQVCVIISFDQADEKQGAIIQQKASDPGNWFVAPTHNELLSFLLFPDSQNKLAGIIANQVKVTRISPYQTRGGVNKDSVFFGREQLLAHIMQREPANYLLVGGRQLGKSSLLKLLERRYAQDPGILCYYITLGQDIDITQRMAQALNLPQNSQMNDIAHHIRQKTTDQRLIFLLDETDVLIKDQAQKNYPILHNFRSLSEENRCTFIMAGFWELYYAASYDYQSPIKNFAETLFIADLEPDACRKLAVIPMQLLNYAYESDTLVDLMIEATGRRANLIAITCDALLQKADMQKRVITKDDLDEILDSNAIRASLAGWEQIKLDRVVVYATIHMDRFTISDVIDRLSHTNFKYEVEDLKQSLMRLELSFILVRKHQYYRYCVPVFKKIILESDPERMLEGEVVE